MTQTEIKKEFKQCKNLEELKKVYKRLAKKLHPDVGGDEELFKALQSIYHHIMEHEIYFSNDSKFNLAIEKIISKILHFEDISIEVIGTWIWVTGNTKEIKEDLLKLGFKWASKKKAWSWAEKRNVRRSNKDLEEIRSTYGSVAIKGKPQAQFKRIA